MIRDRRIMITTDAVGGVWTYTLDLAGGLTEAGATVRVVVLGPRLQPDQRADAARRGLDIVETSYPLEWLAADEKEIRAATAGIAALARGWHADLLHLHTPAFAAAIDFDGPVLAANHACVATWWAAVRGGVLPEDFVWRKTIIKKGLRRADIVVVPTQAYAHAVAAVYDLPTAPLTVYNGRAATSELTDDSERDSIFTAGRLWDEGKNVAALDRAAALLPWPVSAAGPTTGPNGAGIAMERIIALGVLSDRQIRRHLASRPIFVAPARFEPFGLAVLEAAQAGCVLVLNDIPTFRELWDGAALFVDSNDSDALAASIRTMIEDRDTRHEFGRKAQNRAARYTIAAMTRGTIAAYERCLAPRTEVALSA